MSKLFLHPVSFKSTSDSTSSSDSTAAVSVKGGLSVLKNGNFGGKLSAVGFSAGNGVISNVATPILSTDACNKAYVDIYTSTFTSPPPPTDFSLEIDSGDLRISSNALSTGLLGGSGTAISVNPVQTLTQLTCSTVSITTSLGMNSKKIQNLATPVLSTDAANKSYVDSKLNGNVLINNLTILGILDVPEPVENYNAASKGYVDNQLVQAGNGLSKIDNVMSINAVQTGITRVGTLTQLNVSGTLTVATPVNDTDASNKKYVDDSCRDSITAGTGLTKSSSILSVNASQSGITSIGPLTSPLSITSTTESTSETTGSLTVSGGVGIAKSISVRGALNSIGCVTGTATNLSGPLYFTQIWDTGATSHVINVSFTNNFDNFAGLVHIYARNASATLGKSGYCNVSFCKSSDSSDLALSTVQSMIKSALLTTFSIAVSGKTIVVTTDSDISISYTVLVSC